MKRITLQTRFYARLLAVLFGICILFSISLSHYLRVLLETEVADKTQLVFANILAMQTYVRDILRPTMYGTLPPDSFVMEAMSTSYVTRRVMSDFNTAKEKFIYRRVALDPRNPEFGADDLEREFIARFQADPELKQISRYIKRNGEECYVTARPAVFEESCLSCHGDPSDAPKVLLAQYGATRGFGRHAGEVGGLDSVIMPVASEAQSINQVIVGFILVFACGTMIILGVNHLFFDRMTVVNISRLAALMRSRFPAEAGRTLDKSPRRNRDEIEGMLEDMERFADHLREVKEQLRDYAANLEAKVLERTAQARQEAHARQADVRLFLHVLELFVKGADRSSLLDQALEAAAARFGACGASFCCFYSMNARAWPSAGDAPEVCAAVRDTLLDGECVFSARRAIVPVQAANTVRGALTMDWDRDVDLKPQEREVLEAVGRQLGLALENLEAIESILRQKAVLESIFEGIADPLFLLAGSGDVLHANESGHQLLRELGDGCDALGLAQLAQEACATHGATITRDVLVPQGRSLTLRAYPMIADADAGPGGPGMARAVVFARDDTVEKTMLAKLQQSEKSMAVGMLAAGLAHEINNPLGVILCYARLLWDDGKSPNAPDLDIIIRYTLQAQKVLEDLLRFARPKPEHAGAVNVADVAGFMARVFTGKAAKAGLTIQADVPPDVPPVLANSSALEQILTNLMLNAVDALEEHHPAEAGGGLIRLEARDVPAAPGQPRQVRLTVRDNGPGIDPDDARRIFDPFFTTKEVGKGTGLGLSVVYGLVRDLGGAIEVEHGGGAAFHVYLPAVEEDGYGDE